MFLLNTTCPVLANSVDPDQLASEEANWSESALFDIKYKNFYQIPGSSNLIDWKLGVSVASIYSAWQGLSHRSLTILFCVSYYQISAFVIHIDNIKLCFIYSVLRSLNLAHFICTENWVLLSPTRVCCYSPNFKVGNKFFPFRVHPFFRRVLMHRYANRKPQKLSPFVKMVVNISSVLLPLKPLKLRCQKQLLVDFSLTIVNLKVRQGNKYLKTF